MEIGQALRHGKITPRKVIFECPPRYRPVPVARSPLWAGHGWQIRRSECPIAAHLLQHGFEVAATIVELAQRVVFRWLVGRSAVRQQRPGITWNDRRLVRPLFREVTRVIHKSVESAPVVGAQPGPQDEVVGRHQYVHEIELQYLQ